MTCLELSPVDAPTDSDELVHLFCFCNPDVGLCGADLTGAEFCAPGSGGPECVVCEAMAGGSPLECLRCV